jgi:hypothetical protein
MNWFKSKKKVNLKARVLRRDFECAFPYVSQYSENGGISWDICGEYSDERKAIEAAYNYLTTGTVCSIVWNS